MPESTIREVLAEHARLNADAAGLGRAEDLYAAGMTSHASVNVMLALEEAFDIEFPDELLRRSTFTSIQTIEQAVGGLTGQE